MPFSRFFQHLPMDSALNSPVFHQTPFTHSQVSFPFLSFKTIPSQYLTLNKPPTILRCSTSSTNNSNNSNMAGLSVKKKRKRYRKQYPGESQGISEEMRFVAMRLRNIKGKKVASSSGSDTENTQSEKEDDGDSETEKRNDSGGDGEAETWCPSMEGFLKYLVDSKLVFNTIEHIVDESNDVSYAYFRKTGLERSACLSKDLEWFSQRDFVVPEPSNPGVSYVTYLEELAEKSAPLFLAHFFNIYFSHIAGGQVIARKVSKQLLEGMELEFYKWEGDEQESLKGVRKKLNMLGEHWSRDDQNKCLKEAAKSFKFLGEIVRLIIL
ncbi:putative inactive heme oxygenase 2 [Hibiscus syriacus]|uniref:Inactive heme oxygenase 2 n=1 Tax=Hibiscus syriacus TaxID=106335 RepID=A0A6A2XH96_HIBSY|nr:probable inactive heme oxygenase 2, chloroplastic [Hibiscus syriacus]KAE8669130.1 putative inactive heme oxygenase 2 [Hibiscus syriacus]